MDEAPNWTGYRVHYKKISANECLIIDHPSHSCSEIGTGQVIGGDYCYAIVTPQTTLKECYDDYGWVNGKWQPTGSQRCYTHSPYADYCN